MLKSGRRAWDSFSDKYLKMLSIVSHRKLEYFSIIEELICNTKFTCNVNRHCLHYGTTFVLSQKILCNRTCVHDINLLYDLNF